MPFPPFTLPLFLALALVGCGSSSDGGSSGVSDGGDSGGNGGCGLEGCSVVAPDGGNEDEFGSAIAIDGDRMVVGAKVDDPAAEAGAAYIYERIDSEWSIDQKIQSTSPAPRGGDEFGSTLAIQGDRVVVGAPGTGWENPGDPDDVIDVARAGFVYVFEPDPDGDWVQVQQLEAFDRAEDDQFGASVALDGDWLIVGSNHDDDKGENSGSVYVYRHDGSEYVFDQKLNMTQNGGNDRFGWRVAIQGDILLAAAYWDSYYAIGWQSGSVAIFRRDGGAWTQQQVLIGGVSDEFDQFGYSIDLDDEVIVVGARQYGDPEQADQYAEQGIVFVYRIVAPLEAMPWSILEEVERIEPPEASPGLLFGSSVNIEDGRIIVGVEMDDEAGQRAGAAHVYEYSPGGEWVEEHKLTAPDATTGDRFGFATAISGDTLFVGAPEAGPENDASGAVYQFDL